MISRSKTTALEERNQPENYNGLDIYAECSVEEYTSCDEDTVLCAGLIDPSNPRRSEVRSEFIDDDLDFQFVSEDASNAQITTGN